MNLGRIALRETIWQYCLWIRQYMVKLINDRTLNPWCECVVAWLNFSLPCGCKFAHAVLTWICQSIMVQNAQPSDKKGVRGCESIWSTSMIIVDCVKGQANRGGKTAACTCRTTWQTKPQTNKMDINLKTAANVLLLQHYNSPTISP